jgi:hypothetical protein
MPAPNPTKNHLLAALSKAELKRLRPHLEPVPMAPGLVIYESGRLSHYPTTH